MRCMGCGDSVRYLPTQLVACVTAKEADFDKTYDKMIKELEDSGMDEAADMLTDIIKDKIEISK